MSFWCLYAKFEHISHLVLVFLLFTSSSKCRLGLFLTSTVCLYLMGYSFSTIVRILLASLLICVFWNHLGDWMKRECSYYWQLAESRYPPISFQLSLFIRTSKFGTSMPATSVVNWFGQFIELSFLIAYWNKSLLYLKVLDSLLSSNSNCKV